ncbi:MAG: MFS transporter [Thermoplasmata archaeon HGW-Thermoplasmata-1]|nr:MAG: MFS transporter [Thermoplasmata archaeon HGW-Thermoplasmata-1]
MENDMKTQKRNTFSRNIILLGIVSFLTDVSSEMMMPLLPFFLATMGGGVFAVGLISGVGDAVASLLKVFSGHWSDRSGRKKDFVLGGYGISVISKIGIALSSLWWQIGIFYPVERIGKGIRTAPRDALIADSCDATDSGKWFGVHRAMDTAGAIAGSALAFVFLWIFGFSYRTIFLIAVLPAAASLLPLLLVKERRGCKGSRLKLSLGIKSLPGSLLGFIAAATVFSIGNFSYMFFILAAREALFGFEFPLSPTALAILLYVFFNMVYSALAIPFGKLSDRLGKKRVIGAGYATFVISCGLFAATLIAGSASLAVTMTLLCVGFTAYGAFYAMMEGNQRALAADLAPKELRGTALGTFHTAIGIATIPAGLAAGLLWDNVAPQAAFIYGALTALTALAVFFAVNAKYRDKTQKTVRIIIS